jgi:hypothetical protein
LELLNLVESSELTKLTMSKDVIEKLDNEYFKNLVFNLNATAYGKVLSI